MDELTLDDFARYARFWRNHPPSDWLVAAYLGYAPKADVPAQDDLGALLAMAPGGRLNIGGLR